VAASVKLLPRAQRDLDALAPDLFDQIIEALQLLKQYPYLGPAMVGAFQGFRALEVCRGRYRIVYRVVSEKRLDVAYVRRCRRQTGLRSV
jgi:hypothetical protein